MTKIQKYELYIELESSTADYHFEVHSELFSIINRQL